MALLLAIAGVIITIGIFILYWQVAIPVVAVIVFLVLVYRWASKHDYRGAPAQRDIHHSDRRGPRDWSPR